MLLGMLLSSLGLNQVPWVAENDSLVETGDPHLILPPRGTNFQVIPFLIWFAVDPQVPGMSL